MQEIKNAEIASDSFSPSYDEKLLWLIGNGHIRLVDGVEMLPLRSVAQLGGNVVTESELKEYIDAFGVIPHSVVKRMAEGASLCADIYGSSDAVDILYGAFSEESEVLP